MGRREQQRQRNKIVREYIPGGSELLDLANEVNHFRSRDEHPDIEYIYQKLRGIAETMREQAEEWRKEDKASD